MAENRLIYGILTDVLGKPKKRNESKQQFAFDCPTCSAEKGEYEGDGKGNLEVNLAEGVYHCWACGEINGTKGGLKKLFRKFATKDQVKKLKMIGYNLDDFKSKLKDVNVIEDLTLPKNFISFEEGNPKSILYKQAWNYLTKQRKLSKEIINKFKMGFVSGGQYDSRVVVPSYDINNELNYWATRTYVNARPKYLNPDSDKEQIIFNEPHFSQQMELREGNKKDVINNLLNPDKLVYSYQEEGKYGDVIHCLHFKISNTRTLRLPLIFDKNNKKSLYIITAWNTNRKWQKQIQK